MTDNRQARIRIDDLPALEMLMAEEGWQILDALNDGFFWKTHCGEGQEPRKLVEFRKQHSRQ